MRGYLHLGCMEEHGPDLAPGAALLLKEASRPCDHIVIDQPITCSHEALYHPMSVHARLVVVLNVAARRKVYLSAFPAVLESQGGGPRTAPSNHD